MCCDLCWKEFKGWCRSFTRTERALTILEAILLVALVSFLIFLILHFLACSTPKPPKYEPPQEESEEDEYEETEEMPDETTKHVTTTKHKITTTKHKTTTTKRRTTTTTAATTRGTIEPGLECSWTPSAKTSAYTHYYEKITKAEYITLNAYTPMQTSSITRERGTVKTTRNKRMTKKKTTITNKIVQTRLEHNIDFIEVDQSDGEDADSTQAKYILSLVKLKPPQGVIFGCILTIISDFYVLTSASCIEAIEEVDSLDSFVIMEQYGNNSNGKIRSIFDLQIHPFYQGTNKSYDLALIKSESSFVDGRPVELPSPLDFLTITIGERFHLLGFGSYRSAGSGAGVRALRKVYLYRLPAPACAGAGRWAARHLAPGARAVPRGAAPAPALCAGVLYARGLPCNYCSGAPLMRGARLLGLMSDNQQCGVACEPQLYVNVAAVRDWIDGVIGGE